MDIITLLKGYPIPITIVSTLLIMAGLSKFVFPHIPSFAKVFTSGRDAQIKELTEKVLKLELMIEEINRKYAITQRNENRLIGLLKGLSFQLSQVGVDINPLLDDIYSLEDEK